MNAILLRRSIRHYTSDPVPSTMITDLLRAAMAAPSAGNEQPWQFVVINDRTILDKIPRFHPFARMLHEANTAILVCGDLSRVIHEGFWAQDCAAATENLLLAATELKLGAVWVAVYPREERVAAFRELLEIPQDIVPFALVPVGFPDEEKEPVDRFDSRRIHYNAWLSDQR